MTTHLREYHEKIKRGDIVILETTSMDKVIGYKLLAFLLGVNVVAKSDFGKPTSKTPELTNTNAGNASEKMEQALSRVDENTEAQVKRQVSSEYPIDRTDEYLRDKNSWVVVEDSSFVIDLGDEDLNYSFTKAAVKLTNNILPKEDQKYLDVCFARNNGQIQGYPNVNLKDIVEHLPGGFPQMMNIVYNALDEIGYDGEIGTNTTIHIEATNISTKNIGSIHLQKNVEAKGKLVNRERYEKEFNSLKPGEVMSLERAQIPLGQKNGAEHSIDYLIKEAPHLLEGTSYHRAVSFQAICDDSVKWGKTTVKNRVSRDPRLAAITSEAYFGGSSIAKIDSYLFTGFKSDEAGVKDRKAFKPSKITPRSVLVKDPNAHMLEEIDVLLVQPSGDRIKDAQFIDDLVVELMTHPESSNKSVVIDNRTGEFDNRGLGNITHLSKKGAHFGDVPITVLNKGDDINSILESKNRFQRRQYQIDRTHDRKVDTTVEHVPDDKVPTLGMFGGHANNAAEYKQKAKDLAYHAAKKGWRVVTGGGIIDGPMGQAYVGFIQYHLDELVEDIEGGKYTNLLPYISKYIEQGDNQKLSIDAEKIISDKGKGENLLNLLNDVGIIPKDKFYAYSTEELMLAESVTKRPPAGVTYYDAGNLQRRMENLFNIDVAAYMDGASIGTHQELKRSMQLEGLQHVVSNPNGWYDETLKLFGHSVDKHSKTNVNSVDVVTDPKDNMIKAVDLAIQKVQKGDAQGRSERTGQLNLAA